MTAPCIASLHKVQQRCTSLRSIAVRHGRLRRSRLAAFYGEVGWRPSMVRYALHCDAMGSSPVSPRDRSSAQDGPRLPPDEERRIIHQGLTDHYRRTLDEPIPSLGNQSPRKAAKTGKGREKVIGWLKMLENHSAQQGRDDPVGSYDFPWIWKELGLGDERR
jgi:hypothetical protein